MSVDFRATRTDDGNVAQSNKRRALIVSFYFPPYRTIGAVRVGKFAKFLIEQGWDIRVISAIDTAPSGIPLEVSERTVVRTRWFNIDDMFSLRGLYKKSQTAFPSNKSYHSHETPNSEWASGFKKWLHKIFFLFAHWPDRYIGWYPYAVEAGTQLIDTWRPDVIFASSPPPTTLLVAKALARRHGLPWIAEFRDPWVDNPYYEYPRWRYYLERMWEKHVIGRCDGVVSVSPVVHEQFERKYHKPGVVAMNGFDPADFLDRSDVGPVTGGPLRIVFTGHIYLNYSDPTILFEAIRALGDEGRQIRVEFYGTSCEAVLPVAEKLGVRSSVAVHPAVSYREALTIQMTADVLLSIQWINEKEISRIAAKIFEYLAAGRPILAIGYGKGPLVDLLHGRQAGAVCGTASDVLRHLRQWLAQKRDGGIPALPPSVTAGLTRSEQFANAVQLMDTVIQSRSNPSQAYL